MTGPAKKAKERSEGCIIWTLSRESSVEGGRAAEGTAQGADHGPEVAITTEPAGLVGLDEDPVSTLERRHDAAHVPQHVREGERERLLDGDRRGGIGDHRRFGHATQACALRVQRHVEERVEVDGGRTVGHRSRRPRHGHPLRGRAREELELLRDPVEGVRVDGADVARLLDCVLQEHIELPRCEVRSTGTDRLCDLTTEPLEGEVAKVLEPLGDQARVLDQLAHLEPGVVDAAPGFVAIGRVVRGESPVSPRGPDGALRAVPGRDLAHVRQLRLDGLELRGIGRVPDFELRALVIDRLDAVDVVDGAAGAPEVEDCDHCILGVVQEVGPGAELGDGGCRDPMAHRGPVEAVRRSAISAADTVIFGLEGDTWSRHLVRSLPP